MEGGAARGWVVRPCYGSGAKPRPIEPPCTALLFARDLNAHWRLGLPSPLLRFQELLQGPVISEDLVHVTFLRKSTCSMVIIRFFLEHQTMQHSKQRDSLSGTLLLVHRWRRPDGFGWRRILWRKLRNRSYGNRQELPQASIFLPETNIFLLCRLEWKRFRTLLGHTAFTAPCDVSALLGDTPVRPQTPRRYQLGARILPPGLETGSHK